MILLSASLATFYRNVHLYFSFGPIRFLGTWVSRSGKPRSDVRIFLFRRLRGSQRVIWTYSGLGGSMLVFKQAGSRVYHGWLSGDFNDRMNACSERLWLAWWARQRTWENLYNSYSFSFLTSTPSPMSANLGMWKLQLSLLQRSGWNSSWRRRCKWATMWSNCDLPCQLPLQCSAFPSASTSAACKPHPILWTKIPFTDI